MGCEFAESRHHHALAATAIPYLPCTKVSLCNELLVFELSERWCIFDVRVRLWPRDQPAHSL